MIKFCGCVNFYYFVPRGARVCNGTEMLCIIENKMNIDLQSLKNEECLPNCEGTSLVVYESHKNFTLTNEISARDGVIHLILNANTFEHTCTFEKVH